MISKSNILRSTLVILGTSFLSFCGSHQAGSMGASYISPATKNIPVHEEPAPEVPIERTNITVFVTALKFNGDLLKAAVGAVSAREAADALCEANRTVEMEDREIRALISIDTTDQISSMSALGLPADKPFISDLGIEIAANFADLLDSTIAINFHTAVAGVELDEKFWTGSLADGTAEAENCLSWKSDTGSGVVGLSNAVDAQWLASGADDCAEQRKLICVAF